MNNSFHKMISEELSVNGGKLYYETTGDGLPVVLIHAGYLDSRMWDSQFETFSRQYQVIRYDVRGYGKSSRSESNYSDAVDLKSILDHLKIDRAVLVGVSMGGRIALDFAVEYIDRVRALVLINFGIRGYISSGPEEDGLFDPIIETRKDYLKLREEGKLREAAAIDVNLWNHALSKETREYIMDIATENVYINKYDPKEYQVSPEPRGRRSEGASSAPRGRRGPSWPGPRSSPSPRRAPGTSPSRPSSRHA
jgi:pimeloyl-ACP methyl ester carboxylesterase